MPKEGTLPLAESIFRKVHDSRATPLANQTDNAPSNAIRMGEKTAYSSQYMGILQVGTKVK